MNRTAFSADLPSAGSNRPPAVLLVLAAVFLAAAGLAGTRDDAGGPVELSFPVPEGSAAVAGVALQDGGLTVRLPPGGGVPQDVVAESRGLVESGTLHHESDGSLRYEIRLATGILDQVLMVPGHLVLRLRPAAAGLPGGGQRPYRLGAGDKVQITVVGHPDLLTLLVVGSNGKITAPLVGEVQAGGRTVQELAADLAGRLAADYLVNPQVDVQVMDYKSQWVLVTGQVVRPGRVFLEGGTTLKEIIGEAGGLTALAGSRILVSESPAGGQDAVGNLEVDREEFEKGRTHVVPRHGSIVHVEKISYAYIQGEVGKPGTVLLEPGMTLLKAVALSGGLTEWADRKEIRILSDRPGSEAKVYNLKRIQAQKDADPLLEEGQMIIVPRRFL